ncbi:MAG: type II toxin-antitoxin system PemK/MazF family toxin [Pleurocapsa sp. SU_196_0]|nr:type II toxin-antitoxin system PemK/MazF family toxin [Pleurocapsa sp. SU_196_0]
MMLLRGDIALVNFDPAHPGEAANTRPAVIMTNNVANLNSPVIVVIPLTSNTERVYPFELLIPTQQSGLDMDSKAQPQLIRHVSRGRVGQTIGKLQEALMTDLETRLKHHLGMN